MAINKLLIDKDNIRSPGAAETLVQDPNIKGEALAGTLPVDASGLSTIIQNLSQIPGKEGVIAQLTGAVQKIGELQTKSGEAALKLVQEIRDALNSADLGQQQQASREVNDKEAMQTHQTLMGAFTGSAGMAAIVQGMKSVGVDVQSSNFFSQFTNGLNGVGAGHAQSFGLGGDF